MNKFKKVWNDYFEGGVAMWSYFGYNYHSYLITKYILPKINIPAVGNIIQLGTGLGTTVEMLCFLFGEDRVVGYDLFNPLLHPNIKFLDTETTVPLDKNIAYLEIDVGSVGIDMGHRKKLLDWAIENIRIDGYILTNKILVDEIKDNLIREYSIIDLNSFDIPELWKNVHETRLNTKVLLKLGVKNG